MINLPQAWPGSQKRKYTNFQLPHWCAIQLMKNLKMIWVCRLPFSSVSNVPTVHMWLLHFAHPYRVSHRVCKGAVTPGKWNSPCHPSRGARKHLSGQPGVLGAAAPPTLRGRTHTLTSSNHVHYSLFSTTLFKTHWRQTGKQAATEKAGCWTVEPLSLVNSHDLLN